jgi:hypothetical protein
MFGKSCLSISASKPFFMSCNVSVGTLPSRNFFKAFSSFAISEKLMNVLPSAFAILFASLDASLIVSARGPVKNSLKDFAGKLFLYACRYAGHDNSFILSSNFSKYL